MEPNSRTKNLPGLGTISFVVGETGPKNVRGKISLTSTIEGAPSNSQVVVNVNLNGGSAFYTGKIGAEGFDTGTYASAGDVINVIISSSAAVDQGLNNVKSTVSFY